MSWMEIAKQENLAAEQSLGIARTLLGLAIEAHKDKPTRENEIAVASSRRLVKESEAVLAEWQLDDGRGE